MISRGDQRQSSDLTISSQQYRSIHILSEVWENLGEVIRGDL